jgi:UDP-N-acetylmuramoyl-tripeptide--D-alanyl-D-alanine ligase
MWIAVLVAAGVATGLAIRRHLHIFQLNEYAVGAQLGWLARHRTYWAGPLVGLVCALTSLAWPTGGAIAVLVWLVIAAGANWRTGPAKKPLVYTARVKRLLVTIGLLVAALAVVTALVSAPARPLLGALAYVVTPLWPVVANVLNAPVEAAVRQHYLRDARRLLGAQPGLIRIGITGSYGKTSLKYYLATLLKGHYAVLMTPESYNTPMGITKTIRGQLRATHQVFVCEMGARRPGEIRQCCQLVGPSIGVITAIGEQHLETFGSQAAILATKLELASAVRGRGRLYLNGDNALLRAHQPDQDCWWYGLGADNQTVGFDIAVSGRGTRFSVRHNGLTIPDLATPLIGAHTVQNLVGAIAVALDLGVSPGEVRAQLRKLTPAPHRLALSRSGDVTLIDDAYNSNPAGAAAALDTLGLFSGTKILITPGMVELGERQAVLNEQFGAQAAICDRVWLVGAKQTEPVAKGLLGAGFDPARLRVVDDVGTALAQARALPGEKVILVENDLPDNY